MINNWHTFKRKNNLQLETLKHKRTYRFFIKNFKKQIIFLKKLTQMINNWHTFRRKNNLQLETLKHKKNITFYKKLEKQIRFFEKANQNDKQLANI